MARDLVNHSTTADTGSASIRIDPANPVSRKVPPTLFGKFAEHLGWNIYHGMEAQLLFNPTMGEWPFPIGTVDSPDGGQQWVTGDDVDDAIDEYAAMQEYPSSDPLKDAYVDGTAFWWMRHGTDDAVRVSPDIGPTGDRAQRIETNATPADERAGIAQWIYLPLQRSRTYELEGQARAVTESTVRVALERTTTDGDPKQELASNEVEIGTDWTELSETLTVAESHDVGADELLRFSVTVDGESNLILDRILLYPDDHIGYADLDIIKFLQDADLPLLRWPGGNFVSGYHWEEGIGPRSQRPTTANPAWGGLEYNLFGTDEFLAFCDAVGTEPLLCVNAGTGTPEEAARWVEYCNGDPDETEMGTLRSENGHPEPYDVTYWELGNELHGKWQVNWTTPDGYVDRFKRFRAAMKKVDPEIEILGCGNRHAYDGKWNETLLDQSREDIDWLTDHLLVGGLIDDDTDPHAFCGAMTGFSAQLAAEYRELLSGTPEGTNLRVAMTELQLFPRYDGKEVTDTRSLPAAWHYSRRLPESVSFPSKKTIAEALFDATILNQSIRDGDMVDIITHSATVNHGGGLQKRKERVWADPCHYTHKLYRPIAGSRPLPVDIECPTYSTEEQFGQVDPVEELPLVDVLAVMDHGEDTATAEQQRVFVFLVHRSATPNSIDVTLDFESSATTTTVSRTELVASSLSEENTYSQPKNISPETSQITVDEGTIRMSLPPYSLTRLKVPLSKL